MKATVIKRLNKRNFPSAEGNLPLQNPHEPGDIINVVEEVRGSILAGTTNDTWFRTDKGYFVWSGGTDHSSLNEKIKSFSGLPAVNWDKIASLGIIEKYIQNYEADLLRDYGADSVMATLKVKEGFNSNVPCIQFMVTKKGYSKSQSIPLSLSYQEYSIITDVLEGELPCIQSGKLAPGTKVFQENLKDNYGTLGMMAYRIDGNLKKNYFMSCYHVFCLNQLNNGVKEINIPPTHNNGIFIEDNGVESKFATLVEGIFDPANGLDVAIAEVLSNTKTDFHPILFPTFPKEGILIPNVFDIVNKMKVYGFGSNSNKMQGTIVSTGVNTPVEVNGTKYYFKDVIPISKMSEPGDSGSLVFNNKGKILGLLFAGNSNYSYIISISKILNKLQNIQLYYENR